MSYRRSLLVLAPWLSVGLVNELEMDSNAITVATTNLLRLLRVTLGRTLLISLRRALLVVTLVRHLETDEVSIAWLMVEGQCSLICAPLMI